MEPSDLSLLATLDALREGSADLAIGIYGELPPEVRTRQLVTDRFVCIVRKDHPTVKQRLSLEQFLQQEHVQVAPRGKSGGYIDDVLAGLGHERRVARAVPYFMTGLTMVARTDYVRSSGTRGWTGTRATSGCERCSCAWLTRWPVTCTPTRAPGSTRRIRRAASPGSGRRARSPADSFIR